MIFIRDSINVWGIFRGKIIEFDVLFFIFDDI